MLSDPNAAAAIAAEGSSGKGGPKVAAEYNMAQLNATGSSGMVFANPVYDMETTAASLKADEIDASRKYSSDKFPQPSSAVIAPSSSQTMSPEAVKVTMQTQRHRSMDPSTETTHDKAQLVQESSEDVADV
jgi:hypothetical protein